MIHNEEISRVTGPMRPRLNAERSDQERLPTEVILRQFRKFWKIFFERFLKICLDTRNTHLTDNIQRGYWQPDPKCARFARGHFPDYSTQFFNPSRRDWAPKKEKNARWVWFWSLRSDFWTSGLIRLSPTEPGPESPPLRMPIEFPLEKSPENPAKKPARQL